MLGRPVRLAAAAPEDPVFEEVWPGIDGLAPRSIIESTAVGTEPSGEPVSRFALGMAAPAGTFFDLAPVHLLTTSMLDRLTALAPTSQFDVRRYRPNVLVDTGVNLGAGAHGEFVELGWTGITVALGADVRLTITMPTMRCVMTALAQPGLPEGRETLRTVATHARTEIPGLGAWACAGVYADLADGGTVRIGDAVAR